MSKPEPEPVVINANALVGAVLVVAILAAAIGIGFWYGRGPRPEGAGDAVAVGDGVEVAAPTVAAIAGAPGAATAPRSMPAAPAAPTLDLGTPAPSFTDEPPTEQILFRPPMPAGEPRGGGVCEHESTLAPRADAWHCLVENQPYDPCYQVEGEDDLVICGAQPGFEEQGFLVRLVVPLTGNRVVDAPDEPWIVGIDDTTCDRIIGMGMVEAVTFGAKPLRYGCRDGTNLVDLVRDGATWAAQRVTLRFEGGRPAIDAAEWVPVRQAWR